MCVVFFGGQQQQATIISCVSNYLGFFSRGTTAKAPGETREGLLSKYMVLSMTLTGVISTWTHPITCRRFQCKNQSY